jgi:hypothetical protein
LGDFTITEVPGIPSPSLTTLPDSVAVGRPCAQMPPARTRPRRGNANQIMVLLKVLDLIIS